MHERRPGNPIARNSGDPALVTDTVILADSSGAEAAGPRDGDVIYGLRIGLALSAAIWAGMIFLGLLIFG